MTYIVTRVFAGAWEGNVHTFFISWVSKNYSIHPTVLELGNPCQQPRCKIDYYEK